MRTYSMRAVRALAILIVAAFVVSAVPMVASESPAGDASAAANEGYVRVGWLSKVVNWNPLAIEMVEDYVACYLIHSALFTYDQDWNGPVNDLATGYTYTIHTNGSMTTTITITDSAYFRSNDDIDDTTHPLTADDVVFSLNTIKNNEGGAFDWYLLEVSDIKKVDAYTISLWTPYQKATLIDDISSLPIVPKYVWEGISNPLGGMLPGDLVGSGPFVYEDQLPNQWYKFKRAPNYHGAADYPGVRDVDPGLLGIIYTVYTDVPAMCLEMNKGTEDCIVLTGDVDSFIGTLGHKTTVEVYKAAVQENGITDVAINAIPKEFRTSTYCDGHVALLDSDVRKAIMMTLNKDYINNTLLGGLAMIGDSVVDPGFWHKDIENELPYDPAGAKAMLMADGKWEDTDGDTFLEATSKATGVKLGYFPAGTELSGIRCQAPDTDPTYGYLAIAWQGWAKEAGIGFVSSVESEITMINDAWYKTLYDIWVWHWGWGSEPLGGALTCWLSSEIEEGGDNCQMPMGEWWVHGELDGPGSTVYEENYSTCDFVNASMIEEFGMDEDGFRAFSSFDQNVSIAQHTLDIDGRKAIVDDLQQVVYDSYTENPPYYDLGLYGYTDYNFEGWGDWEAHNGLNICSDLLWIWFQLEPVDNRAPKFDVPPEEYYTTFVSGSEDFVVAVSDAEGDDLWVNYTFGDGDTESYPLTGDTTKVTYVNTSHPYLVPGLLNFSVSLTDMAEGRALLYRNATVEVQGEINYAPQFTSAVTYDVEPPAYTGVPVTWSVSAEDPDGGTQGTDLRITWDWGDFTYTVEDYEGLADGEDVTSNVVHTWTVAWDYTVTVSVYDFGGSEDSEYNVSVDVDYLVIANQPPESPLVQPINGLEDEVTTCIATSSDPDPEDVTFTWDWGNGSYTVETVTNPEPGESLTSEVTYTWDDPGSYLVTVWADDGQPGHNESTDVTAVILPAGSNVWPTAFALTATPSPVYVGVDTTFNASAIDGNGDVLTITVDFGDGNISSDTTDGGVTTRQYVEFVHAYELADTYSVVVYADDGSVDGNISSEPFEIVVSEAIGNSEPEMQLPTSFQAFYNVSRAYAPLAVDDEDGDEVTVWYDWGDGTPLTKGDADDNFNATHIYREVKTFTLSVSANDSHGANVTETSSVVVNEANQKPAVERIDVEPEQDEYKTGETITFIVVVADLEGDSVTVVIEFGDGETDDATVDLVAMEDYEVEFTHAYDAKGEYEVNATVDDGMDHSNPALVKFTLADDIVVVSEGINMLLVAGILIALIVIVVVVALLLKKKKGKAPETLGGMEGMAPAEEPPPQ